MKKIFKFFYVILFIFSISLMSYAVYIDIKMPNTFYISENQEFELSNNNYIGLSNSVSNINKTKSCVNGLKEGSTFKSDLNLFGVIPVKSVEIKVVKKGEVAVCGTPFGLKMFTKGVIVVGTTDIETNSGLKNPSKESGIKVGDIILSADSKKISSNESLISYVAQSNGKEISLIVLRNDVPTQIPIKAVQSTDGSYRIGIWVRDSSAGIGTMTFYDKKTGYFAGLGHAICDSDTGEIMPLSTGEIADVIITGVNKGKKGAPGELKGYFDSKPDNGSLLINNETGVYGLSFEDKEFYKYYPIAMKQQIKEGPAKIITTIDNKGPKEYDVIIEKVNISSTAPTKNMIIKIIDAELIEKTGGIVQGMSGSPIIQENMLIGAVTHVFVNDPQKGYAIFSENMINNFDILTQKLSKKAS